MADLECQGCLKTYALRDGGEPTGYCDPCAQDMVQDALRYRWIRERRGARHGRCWIVCCKYDEPTEKPSTHLISDKFADRCIDKDMDADAPPSTKGNNTWK